MMQALDSSVLKLTSIVASRWEIIDLIIVGTTKSNSIKMLPIVCLLWYVWFSKSDVEKARRIVLNAGLGAVLATVVARLIQSVFSNRPRPMHAENPDYVAPYGVDLQALENWSSFPSDHAALAFALASAVFLFSRSLGIFCLSWAAIVSTLPRIYAGYHYASDVLAGAFIGVIATLLVNTWGRPLVCWLHRIVQRLEERQAPLFYTVAFVASYQVTTMMDEPRKILRTLYEAMWSLS
ncbi:phosphatase PAP2 family protein [Halotalea alkalilenta]|nr:phosphatase PAP2 family protein [Halotalea alkalilenta]